MKLKIKTVVDSRDLLPEDHHGNLIDLKASQEFNLESPEKKKTPSNKIIIDDFILSLGIKMQLPKWYRAEIKPRSSLYRKHGVILANHVGEIEWDYSDYWKVHLIKLKDAPSIKRGERIVQADIKPVSDAPWWIKIRHLFVTGYKFVRYTHLDSDRGGFGSTG